MRSTTDLADRSPPNDDAPDRPGTKQHVTERGNGTAPSGKKQRVYHRRSDLSLKMAMAAIDSDQQRDALVRATELLTLELARLRRHDELLRDMHQLTREAAEKIHEREIIIPIALILIGIVDRCCEQQSRWTAELIRHGRMLDEATRQAWRYIRRARRADGADIDSALALLGVESFASTNSRFDPATQRCVERVPCADPALNCRVWEHLRPGYRRNEILIRPELVSVLTSKSDPANTQSKTGATTCLSV